MHDEDVSPIHGLLDRWWVPVVRGAAAILFGIILLAAPGIGLAVLVALWAAYALVDGVVSLVVATRRHRRGRSTGWLVFEGVVSIAAGVVALAWPGITALALLFLIAAWAVVTGVAEIVAAVRLPGAMTGRGLLGVAGVLSLAFGVLLMVYPGSGAVALMWMLGIYAILFGGSLIAFGLQLRRVRRGVAAHAGPRAGAPVPA